MSEASTVGWNASSRRSVATTVRRNGGRARYQRRGQDMAGDVGVTVALDGVPGRAAVYSVAKDVTSAGDTGCLTSKAVVH